MSGFGKVLAGLGLVGGGGVAGYVALGVKGALIGSGAGAVALGLGIYLTRGFNLALLGKRHTSVIGPQAIRMPTLTPIKRAPARQFFKPRTTSPIMPKAAQASPFAAPIQGAMTAALNKALVGATPSTGASASAGLSIDLGGSLG